MKQCIAMVAMSIGLSTAGLAAEPSDKDFEAMQGTWTVESFLVEGSPIADETLKTWRRIVENNHVTWKQAADTLVELDIKVDASPKLMTLDSTIATGETKGQTMLAIYELKDDELRVCFTAPGKPRPSDFSSVPGSGRSTYTCKRLKR